MVTIAVYLILDDRSHSKVPSWQSVAVLKKIWYPFLLLSTCITPTYSWNQNWSHLWSLAYPLGSFLGSTIKVARRKKNLLGFFFTSFKASGQANLLDYSFGLSVSFFSSFLFLLPFASQMLIQGCLPTCSAQYERMFNTTRVPGLQGGRMLLHTLPSFPNKYLHTVMWIAGVNGLSFYMPCPAAMFYFKVGWGTYACLDVKNGTYKEKDGSKPLKGLFDKTCREPILVSIPGGDS